MSVLSDFLAGVKSTASKAKAGAKKVSSYLPKAGDFAQPSKATSVPGITSGAKLVKDLAVGTARLPVTLPTKAMLTFQQKKSYTPVTGLEKFLVGNAPVTSYTADQDSIQKWAKDKGLSGNQAIAIGAIGAIGEAGLDFFTGGKGKTVNTIADLAKANTASKVSKIANQANLSLSKETFELLAKESDPIKISNILNIGIEDSNFRRSVAAGLSQRAAQLEKEIAIANQAPVLDFAKIAKLEQEKIDLPKMMKDLPKMDKDSVFEMNKFLNTRNIDAFKINEQGIASGSLPGRIELPKTDPLLQEAGNLSRFERAKNLSPEDFKIEDAAFRKIDAKEKEMLAEYTAEKGKYVNADDFRPFFKEEGYAGHNAAAVQEPSSYLAKRAYTEGLKNDGEFATLFSGGSGSGKTSAIKGIPEMSKLLQNSAVVFDGNLSGYESAIKKITEAHKAGKKTPIVYVYREPVDSFVEGVVKRMINNADEMGRLVPSDVVAGNHIDSWDVAKRLHSDGFDVRFVDNSLGGGKARKVSFEELNKKISYPSKSQLTEKFNAAALKLLRDKKISPEQYTGFTKKNPPVTLKGFVGGGKLPKDAPASKIMDFLKSKPKGQKERGLSRQIRNSPEITLDLAKRVEAEGLKYTAKKNSGLIKRAQSIIAIDPMEAERIAKTGLNDEAVAIGSEYIKELGLAAQRTKDVATRNALLDKAVEIASIQAERLTEAGRAVQAASIISKLSPEGVLRYASTLIKKAGSDVKITADQAEKLLAHAKKIEGITNPTERAKEMFKLFDSINELIPSSLGEQMVAVWKAGLLTGLKTTGINIFSNIVHGVSEIVKDVPAAAVDSVISLFTGKRTKTLGVKGLGGGLKEGFEKGWEYLRTGFDERNIGAKLDYKKVNFGTSKVGKGLQKYEELVFRTIGSEDQPFYYGAKARSLYDQAAAKAINAKVPKAERTAFIEDLVQNPTDDMIEISVRDAETAVFSRDNVLARAATGLARPLGATGDFIMPFKKTPSNVLLQALNYTPAGPVMEIAKQIKAGKFDQRMLSEAIGRGTVGTGVFALGGMLAADGLITAKAPDSETERKQWELEGKQANSISLDGGKTWKSLSALGPIGTVMIIGAYYQNALKETGSRTEAMKAAIAGAGRATVDQTFLKGVSGALNALNDPTRGLSMFVENTVGSTIPTIIADIARAKDTTKREVNGAAESIINRIPGWRETLPEKLDVFGKPIAEANGLAVMVDIFRTSKRELSSPEKETVSELSRLAKAGYTATPANIKKNQTINGVETIIDQKQINDFKKQFGEDSLDKLKTLIESRDYKNSSDEDKANMIDSVVSEAKRIAKIKVLGEEGSNKDQARILHEELKKLPKDEANAVAEEIRSRDKKVFESLKSVVMEEKAGITPKDKQLRSLGVENGERARTIYDEVTKLNTKEEKNSYIEELRKKKVISDAVMKQLRQIIREEKEMQAQE